MWHYEHGVEATATPEHIWRYWSDIAAWPQWNDGIEKIEIDGPFAVGTMFTMTRRGGPRCAAIGGDRAGQLFTDEMDAGDFVVRTVHRLEPTATGRTRITHQTEITGPAAGQVGPQFGPAITADFPGVLAALVCWRNARPCRSAQTAVRQSRWACPAALGQSTSLRCPTMPGADLKWPTYWP